MGRRLALWALVVSLIFLAFGGLYGGLSMLRDPSGAVAGDGHVLRGSRCRTTWVRACSSSW